MSHLKYLVFLLLLFACSNDKTKNQQEESYNEPYRPQVHFSPPAHWMNDPNGMVFYNGTYHLFYQYFPDSTVWGPMHWGHATTTDLVHWQHQPIALYPDSLGYIFSGSAVVDSANTSGFGKDGKIPLVAIFTQHNIAGEKSGSITFQNQSIAYSLDEGRSWIKYSLNPVLKNPGIKDFRDPKVMWYAPAKKWVMTLATKDRVTFFSSPDLKSWIKESEFGATAGAHGGVWECPDLFPLEYEGRQVWVLLVSINPGGPNGGSATQYFTGDFDGKTFTPFQTDTRWIDYGTDNYAGVTWSNTGGRRIFLGWMSNWQYATVVPTQKWRSAMTVPRELHLEKSDDKFLLASKPLKEMEAITGAPLKLENVAAGEDLAAKGVKPGGPAKLSIRADNSESVAVVLSNAAGEELLAGFDKASNSYFIDRTRSGKAGFEKGFAKMLTAPRLISKQGLELSFIIDKASIELFADDGLSVMTAIFFPDQPFTAIRLQSPQKLTVQSLEFSKMKSIWK